MRILITGASGNLGRRLVRVACQAGHQVYAWVSPTRGSVLPSLDARFTPVELSHPEQVAEAFWQARPMAVIHAGAVATIADCYRDPVRAFRVNAEATRQLVGLCVAGVSRFVYVSTDLVFDGVAGNYREEDPVLPVSQYGKSKLDGERAVLHHPGHLVARLSWLVGRGTLERPNFLDQQIESLRTGKAVELFVDEWRTPLGVETAATALVSLAFSDVSGVLHLGGPARLSRYEMGCQLAKALGAKTELVKPVSQRDWKATEVRPRDVSLDSSLWRELMPAMAWPGYDEVLGQELV